MVRWQLVGVDPDALLSNAEAARLTGFSVGGWHQLRTRGIAPDATKAANGRLYFRAADLERWMNARLAARGGSGIQLAG